MGISKIEIYYDENDEADGLRVRVKDNNATLQDLLDAWQPLCDDERLYKLYAEGQHGVCRACTVNCCNTAYVIPDLIAFKKMAACLQLDHRRFIADYFDREKVAAGLLRMRPDPCIFLKDNICTVYPFRSLICRFYLCSNMQGDCEQLIYSVAWAGSAALQIFAEQNQLIDPAPQAGLSSFDQMFKRLVEEYRYTPQVKHFLHAGDYSDIPLAPFLP